MAPKPFSFESLAEGVPAICGTCGNFEHPEEHGHECRLCGKRFRHADPQCHRTVKVDDLCPRCRPQESR